MKTMKILAAVAVSPVLLSAVVFASTTNVEMKGKPAVAPNRAEIFAEAECGAPVFLVAGVQSWQDALAAKRLHERSVTLAADQSGDCAETGL
ncbi:MAG: hypothetical protein ACK4IU_13535 [Tabrizicola flagellatus]|uniref:hypothetical protein n=1 Tax=Tabrizicola flagellatus TaxID=2593021 RepID=UPI00391A83CF